MKELDNACELEDSWPTLNQFMKPSHSESPKMQKIVLWAIVARREPKEL